MFQVGFQAGFQVATAAARRAAGSGGRSDAEIQKARQKAYRLAQELSEIDDSPAVEQVKTIVEKRIVVGKRKKQQVRRLLAAQPEMVEKLAENSMAMELIERALRSVDVRRKRNNQAAMMLLLG